MLHELRDLDGEVIVRVQADPESEEACRLQLTDTTNLANIFLIGRTAVLNLRDACNEALDQLDPE